MQVVTKYILIELKEMRSNPKLAKREPSRKIMGQRA